MTTIRAIIAGALLLAILGAAWWGHHAGAASVQAKWDADNARLASAQIAAVRARLAENAAIESKQAATAATITRKYHAEIDSVRRALAADRMRRPAFCASAGPARAPSAASAGSGDADDPGTGLLDSGVASRVQALILQSEEVGATARAAQAFIWANGMAPGQ